MNKKDPLFISRSNKRGLFIFLICSLIVVFLPRVEIFFNPQKPLKISSVNIERLVASRREFEERRMSFSFNRYKKNKYKIPRHRFDPNQYLLEDWMKLGLSEKQAAVIVKFCSRGIYTNADLQKIFVLPDGLYQLIKDSTYYPERFRGSSIRAVESSDKILATIPLVDLNTADQAELEQIPGIGPFFARQMIRYRERLGGYVHKNQLLEVWKMDLDRFNKIERYLVVSGSAERINLNLVQVEILRRHPYFDWNLANAIVKMRLQKGNFHSLDELKESVLIDEELYEKIKPYLTL